jgi:hypothetical protein
MTGRLPDFLVIGAMKAGSTTLCRDLAASPDVFFPTVKEPHTLAGPEVETPEGRAAYAALFRDAEASQLCGEGSTGYTKRPVAPDVAARARRVLGPDARLLYIVRDPVDRLVSHHHHLLREGVVPADIDEAVDTVRVLRYTSRYAYQLEPWIEAFGAGAVRVIVFEEYVRDRARGVQEACDFLGVRPPVAGADLERVHNAAHATRSAPSGIREPLRRITRSQFYKRSIHPRIPRWLVDGVQAMLYRSSSAEPTPLSAAKREALEREFASDQEALRVLMGRSEPLWPRPGDAGGAGTNRATRETDA